MNPLWLTRDDLQELFVTQLRRRLVPGRRLHVEQLEPTAFVSGTYRVVEHHPDSVVLTHERRGGFTHIPLTVSPGRPRLAPYYYWQTGTDGFYLQMRGAADGVRRVLRYTFLPGTYAVLMRRDAAARWTVIALMDDFNAACDTLWDVLTTMPPVLPVAPTLQHVILDWTYVLGNRDEWPLVYQAPITWLGLPEWLLRTQLPSSVRQALVDAL
jgi:hypothetical protein